MYRVIGTRERSTYKALSRNRRPASQEVGGGYITVDRKDNITLQEGRPPALIGTYSDEEGSVTAKGKSALAQRTRRKVRVLQDKLYRAAKKDLNCRKHGGKRKNSRIYSGDLYRLGLYRFSGTIHYVY